MILVGRRVKFIFEGFQHSTKLRVGKMAIIFSIQIFCTGLFRTATIFYMLFIPSKNWERYKSFAKALAILKMIDLIINTN